MWAWVSEKGCGESDNEVGEQGKLILELVLWSGRKSDLPSL
jgi:hypothetical protein